MKVKIKIEETFNATHLLARVGTRYWEDATVNGIEDVDGDLIPCRDGDYWCPKINIETGQIENWKQGTTADIHYKSCDDNEFQLLDENGHLIKQIEGYVISTMCPEENGYGDYVIMKIDENGFIQNWVFYPNDFTK